MRITLSVNGAPQQFEAAPADSLLTVLRRAGYYSVKHGCDTGECGACTVLLNGEAVTSCNLLAVQADGARVETAEGLQQNGQLHRLQERFAQMGAVQCGFCTPGMLMAAKALLDKNPNPTEEEVRRALSGTICRCTGYVKPVQAVLQAAADLRGNGPGMQAPAAQDGTGYKVIGHSVRKVDATKLVTGRGTFVDDIELRGLLHGRLLLSPHAHARIRRIDASRAKALPGVHAVLTFKDIPRVTFTTAGQSWPEPSPFDTRSLDDKVRFVGDRVAAVAAETPELAEQALRLIEVDYEVLPAVFDPGEALKAGAPVIHDESDCSGIGGYDARRNLAAEIEAGIGDMAKGFAEADLVIERTYRVPQVQPAPIETHVCITWLDEDGRLVVRSSTQVPFHVRRIIAPVLGLRPGQIRVIKPRIGGGFGVKQEILIEDIAGHLTLRTGRPVKVELSRTEEFMASRSRHPQVIRLKTGVKRDGTLTANEMDLVANTGAYGSHALTVQTNTGSKSLPLYRCPNIRFKAVVAYTNLPPAGAFRGYGGPQGYFALESHMDEVARAIGMDPLEFRLKNCLRAGDENPLARALGEGREGFEQKIVSCGLPECAAFGRTAIRWDSRHNEKAASAAGTRRQGYGVAFAMHGTAIPGLDMGAASLKLNDDGTVNLLVGATDLGTGSDTVLAQIVAEVLGCAVTDVLVYSSDTDMTPFDVGAYASSTTYISGGAVKKVAEDVAQQVRAVAARMMGAAEAELSMHDCAVWSPDGRSVTLADAALNSLHVADQKQIMAVASNLSYDSPPPFAVTFAQVEVDTETGRVDVKKLITAVDAGQVINPVAATGQVEGGMVQALGYAVSEEMLFDATGRMLNPNFRDYRVFLADEMPEIVAHLVHTEDPFGPYGAKALAEIPMDGVAPAIANAVRDATGVTMTEIPLTPERVWRSLSAAQKE
ncbi:MAG: molybdopterin-dependent oxidoreductase [Mycobacterium leprae]